MSFFGYQMNSSAAAQCDGSSAARMSTSSANTVAFFAGIVLAVSALFVFGLLISIRLSLHMISIISVISLIIIAVVSVLVVRSLPVRRKG
jgi:predicted ferric reductase